MNWWDYINPFTYLGNAAGKIVADGWTAAMLGLWNAGLWLLKLVLGIEDDFLLPDLRENGPMRGIYPYTFWIAGGLLLVLLMIQLGIAVFRRDGQSLARIVIGSAQFVIVWVSWVVYAVAVLSAAGGLTRALMQSLLHVDTMGAWQPWSGFSTADITDGTIATVLGVMGMFLVFSAFAHLLVMLARGAALLVLAATNPVAAAGLVWEGGRSWFWKAFRWFHAAAFTPVVMILMLGLGVQVTSHVALGTTDSLQKAVGTAVPGVMLILVGCFAPLALFKMLAFVDPGTSSGAAMRSELSAQGGVQGLLRRGSANGTSDAASMSEAGGRSAGEASAESAASQRGAASAGGPTVSAGGGSTSGGGGLGAGIAGGLGAAGGAVAAGVGLVAGTATRAAVLGADLTNQMGVGHNSYIPDFSSSRSGSRNNAGPSGADNDRGNPQINGAGQGQDAPEPGTVGAPVSPTPTTGQPGGARGGSAGGASAGAGGGAAAQGAGAAPAASV